MELLTNKEKEVIEILKKNPFVEQEELAKLLGITRSSVAGHLARLIKKGILQRGYILNENLQDIAVIGGANIDVKGIADTLFTSGSSNPGKVFRTAGGVGRNVAENLAKLHLPVTLFTVMGNDEGGKWLLEQTRKAGVNTQFVDLLVNERTGTYLSILNDKKEQIGSIADMKIMERLDKEYLKKIISKLTSAKMVFIDTNLPQEAFTGIIEWLTDNKIFVIVDPVSVKKAKKLAGLLDGIDLITPNKEEAEALSGITIKSVKDLDKAASYFFENGVKNVAITLGAEGVYIATKTNSLLLPSPEVEIKDTTGAGDAFVAGVIYGLYNHKDLFEASRYGQSMAAITLSREETVSIALTKTILEETKKELFA